MKLLVPMLGCLVLMACEAGASAGATCTRTSECSADLVCRFGCCRDECRTNRDCGPTESCIFTSDHLGVCQLALDLGCETGVGRMCPAGLICANDRCINACLTSADCPSDGVCRFSPAIGVRVCVDPMRIDSVPDGGVARSGCGLVSDVCVGDAFACALRDGQVLCWGDDSTSQHGDFTANSPYPPTRVVAPDMGPLEGIVEIACGSAHACARNAVGDVLCWGESGSGQLANDGADDTDRATYVHVDPSSPEWADQRALGADRLVLGSGHSIAHRSIDDHWVVWGQNADGELVDMGTTGFGVPTVTYVMAFDHAIAFGVGTNHSCFAGASGVSCHGLVSTEELGSPSALSALTDVTDLALGPTHSCARTASGVVCWGSDALGQLGDGDPAPTDSGCAFSPCSFTPRAVSALPPVAHLVQGSTSNGTCAVTTDGSLWCWGENDRGQIDATGAVASAPVRQSGLDARVCDAALSRRTVCALTASDDGGRVYCWGENGSGQLGILPDGEVHPTPIWVQLPPL